MHLFNLASRHPVIWVLLTLALLGFVGAQDQKEEASASSFYCKMVRLNLQTEGALGWEDYKNNYDEQCE